MRNTIKGVILGALVFTFVSVLAQSTPSWTSPRTWATDDLLTASQFNAQFRDNLLNLRGYAACAENGISGTSSSQTVLFGDCRWAAAVDGLADIPTHGAEHGVWHYLGDSIWVDIHNCTSIF